MNKIKLSCILIAFTILTSMFFPSITAYAQNKEEKPETLKVYCITEGNLIAKDENGEPSGYTYDYLMKVAQRAGWDYEFIIVDSTEENIAKGVEALKNGEVDVFAGAERNDSLDEFFNYPIMPYRQQLYSFLTLIENKHLNDRNILNYDNLRVALDKTAVKENEYFEEANANAGFNMDVVYADNNKECLNLLKSGEADIIVGRKEEITPEIKEVTSFFLKAYYLATSKGNPEFSQRFNQYVQEVETQKMHIFNLIFLTNISLAFGHRI